VRIFGEGGDTLCEVLDVSEAIDLKPEWRGCIGGVAVLYRGKHHAKGSPFKAPIPWRPNMLQVALPLTNVDTTCDHVAFTLHQDCLNEEIKAQDVKLEFALGGFTTLASLNSDAKMFRVALPLGALSKTGSFALKTRLIASGHYVCDDYSTHRLVVLEPGTLAFAQNRSLPAELAIDKQVFVFTCAPRQEQDLGCLCGENRVVDPEVIVLDPSEGSGFIDDLLKYCDTVCAHIAARTPRARVLASILGDHLAHYQDIPVQWSAVGRGPVNEVVRCALFKHMCDRYRIPCALRAPAHVAPWCEIWDESERMLRVDLSQPSHQCVK
jgi:hypothetical protein